MLINIAIGDAYGAGFEFASKKIIDDEHRLTEYHASRIDDLKKGQYTDDTQMTLGIMELMLNEKEWNKNNIAESFLNVFKRDVRHGYAKGFFSFLESIETAEEFNRLIKPNSIRNGAAMRSVPLGFFSDIEDVKEKARLQAVVTHDTAEGIISSQAVALMTFYFLNDLGKKDGLKSFIEKELLFSFIDNKTDRTKCDGIDTINAVLTVLRESNSLTEIIDKSVLLGGDTDSVASIACGIASQSKEFKQDLPVFLFNELENNKYGRDYLIKLNNLFLMKMKMKKEKTFIIKRIYLNLLVRLFLLKN